MGPSAWDQVGMGPSDLLWLDLVSGDSVTEPSPEAEGNKMIAILTKYGKNQLTFVQIFLHRPYLFSILSTS